MAVRATTIGVIGLGRMGSQMASNLFAKRFAERTPNSIANPPAFLVFDAIASASHSFVTDFEKQFPGLDLRVCASPAEVASNSSTILTMLPSTKEVEAVYLQSGGILDTLKMLSRSEVEQTLVIDSTTLAVEPARKVAAQVQDTGAQMVDAPVSGGVQGAKSGTLSFLVGGPVQTFDAVAPLLALMGKRIIHCGDSGAGLAAKICNNLMLGIEQVAVAEAMSLGEAFGLDPTVLSGVINSSTGACWSSSVNNPVKGALPGLSPPCERDFDGGFAMALMHKDMGLAAEMASQTKVELPLGSAAHDLYWAAMESRSDLARKDFSSIYTFLRSRRSSARN